MTANLNPVPETSEKKQNPFQKFVVSPIKKHPKLTIAVVAGLSLVGAAAYFGKDLASDSNIVQGEVVEDDTTVA